MLHCRSAMWRQDRRVHTAQLWDCSFMSPPSQLMSGDGCSMLRCSCYCFSLHSPLVLCVTPKFCIPVFYSLSCLDPRACTENTLLPCQRGRLRVWREVYIHPNSTKLSFNSVVTFSLASVCTLGCTPLIHVVYRDLTNANLFDGKLCCNGLSVWPNRLGMTIEMI